MPCHAIPSNAVPFNAVPCRAIPFNAMKAEYSAFRAELIKQHGSKWYAQVGTSGEMVEGRYVRGSYVMEQVPHLVSLFSTVSPPPS